MMLGGNDDRHFGSQNSTVWTYHFLGGDFENFAHNVCFFWLIINDLVLFVWYIFIVVAKIQSRCVKVRHRLNFIYTFFWHGTRTCWYALAYASSNIINKCNTKHSSISGEKIDLCRITTNTILCFCKAQDCFFLKTFNENYYLCFFLS